MKDSENRTLPEMVVSQSVKMNTMLPPFWSTRPPSEIRLGTNLNGPFISEIERKIEEGNIEKS